MYSQPFDIFFKEILCKINETQVLFSNFYFKKRDACEYVSKCTYLSPLVLGQSFCRQ